MRGQGNPNPSVGATSDERAPRLQYLDVVRAVAALAVVVSHIFVRTGGPLSEWERSHIDLGTFGVLAFFVCSGFIIPKSFGRNGTQARFWARRVFRLWPMYLAAIFVIVVCQVFGFEADAPDVRGLTPTEWATNLLMVAYLVGDPLILRQAWTLSYELLFYVSVSVLHLEPRLHRTEWIAVLGVVGTLVACFGPVTGDHYFVWWSGYILTTMFLGAEVARVHEVRPETRWRPYATLAVGAALGVVCARYGVRSDDSDPIEAAVTHPVAIVAAYGLFATLFAMRSCTFPRPLLRVGLVSYSLYLINLVVIAALPDMEWPIFLVVAIIACVAVAELGFRFVEQPAMRAGRRVSLRR